VTSATVSSLGPIRLRWSSIAANFRSPSWLRQIQKHACPRLRRSRGHERGQYGRNDNRPHGMLPQLHCLNRRLNRSLARQHDHLATRLTDRSSISFLSHRFRRAIDELQKVADGTVSLNGVSQRLIRQHLIVILSSCFLLSDKATIF
jgi:hypothetical protein